MKVETLIKIRGDGKRCLFCGASDNLTIDHLIPVSKGGINEITNYIILCGSCNHLKDNLTLEEFTKKIEKIQETLKDWRTFLTDK